MHDPRPSPGRRWLGPGVAGFLALMCALAIRGANAPTPGSTPSGFSVDRAWRDIEAIARAPHPVGTAEHGRVREYVLDQLDQIDLVVDTQTAVRWIRRGGVVEGARVRNVMGRLSGTASSGAILLLSHYDSKAVSPGAADDGIGVATVLETARALAAGPAVRNDVIFLVTDAEEWNLLGDGASEFAAHHPWMDDVAVVLDFEARGTSGPAAMIETGPGSGWLVELLAREGPRPVSSSLFPTAYRQLPNYTDFTTFLRKGLPGLNFAIGGSAHWYHTSGDTPKHLSRASLGHMGAQAYAVARSLASQDLAERATPEPVYFFVPGAGLIMYAAWLAIPVAALLAATLVATAAYVRRQNRFALGGLSLGLVTAIITIAAAAATAHYAWLAVRGAHPEFGSLSGRALYREWPYVAAFAAAGIAWVFAGFAILRRWFTPETLGLGAILLPAILAVLTALSLPTGSYLTVWPSFVALGMVVLLARWSGRVEHHPGRIGVLVALGALAVVLLAPIIFQLHIFVGARYAPVIAAFAALAALPLVPLVDILGSPNRVWLPALTAGVAALLVGVGLVGRSSSPDRPTPGDVMHLQDSSHDRALWAVPARLDNDFTQRFVGGGGDTITLASFSRLTRGSYRVSEAPRWKAPAVHVQVTSDDTSHQGRVVRVRLRWDEAPRLIEVWPDSDLDLVLVDPLPPESGESMEAGHWTVMGTGLPGYLELAVAAPNGSSIRVAVAAHYPGLPAFPGGPDPVRPPGVMATRPLSDSRIVHATVTF